MSCCPHGAAPYLAADYTAKGTKIEADGVSYYEVGSAEKHKAIVICPDVWGAFGGRTRAIADYFSEQGYYVIVPVLLSPGLEGGIEGDGLPASFDMPSRGADFKAWMQTFSWEANWKGIITRITKVLVAKGITSAGFVGFCAGGLFVCKTVADAETMSPSLWKGGVVAHPSMQLEEFFFGGSTEALMKAVPVPLLLFPCKGDSPNYDAGGAWTSPECESIRFEQAHGFVPRGDTSDANVLADVTRALDLASAFLTKVMP